jgi:hypothetical protein
MSREASRRGADDWGFAATASAATVTDKATRITATGTELIFGLQRTN